MLLTLAATSMRARLHLGPGRAPAGQMRLTDLPRHARDTLGLYGLNVSTDLLAGADVPQLDALREAADKASCPCLVLVKPDALPFFTDDDARGDAAVERMSRVVQAAHRLGCNSAAMFIAAEGFEQGSDTADLAAERLRKVMSVAEKREVNLLIGSGGAPGDVSPGPTSNPEALTDLIKRVGGFRIGTFPDFETASKSDDPLMYLRRLTPYAAAVTAAVMNFKKSRKGMDHEPYDLAEYAKTVLSVGYTGTLALDYRGGGDADAALRLARAALETVAGVQSAENVEEVTDE